MRVISGKYRGRQLVGFKSKHIRPTTDRVKESVFNKLAGEFSEARVLDLFSGTGNLAIEALSRGASWVDLVEMRESSLKIIRENMDKLGIREGFRLHGKDAFKYLKNYSEEPYDVILVDPPFTEKLADSMLIELARSKAYGPETVIVIETTVHESVEKIYPPLERYDERHFGDKIVFFFSPSEDISCS